MTGSERIAAERQRQNKPEEAGRRTGGSGSTVTNPTDPRRAMIATATDVYYYGDTGTEREWRQCRFCLAYAEGEVGSKPTPRHGEPCPVGDLEHICDDTCPAYHERTHAPLALLAASAPPQLDEERLREAVATLTERRAAERLRPSEGFLVACLVAERARLVAERAELREQLAAASAPPLSPDAEQLRHASNFIRAMLDAVGLQGSDREQWQEGSWVSLKELELQVVGLIEDLKVNGASPASPPRAWQPISPDIPKDGTPFLSWNAYQNVAAVTWYSRVHEYFIATGGQHLYRFTHWQPITLPTPPAPQEEW